MLVNKDSTFIIFLIHVHYQMVIKNKKQNEKWQNTNNKKQKTTNQKGAVNVCNT